jgi:crotonobetainyl-CoA:carnitine CoA-transferase CaiB-like acyl-CoA transferase
MAITGDPDRAPLLMGGHIPFSAVGTYTGIAAASALFVKETTGRGQVVDVSAVQCLSGLCEQVMVEHMTTGEVMGRRGARGGITAVAGALPCADGHWMICVPPTDDGWKNFAAMIGDRELIDDTSLEKEAMRRERRDEILDRVEAWSAASRRDALVTQSQERHVPASPVTTPLDLVDDPQLLARGFLRPTDHPLFGRIHAPAGAIAALRNVEMTPAPQLGAHNAEILNEIEKTGRTP